MQNESQIDKDLEMLLSATKRMDASTSVLLHDVFSDVAVSPKERRVVVLVGPQGTGKSTLLDTLACNSALDSPQYHATPEG